MIRTSTYQAAGAVAKTLEVHFAQNLSEARLRGEDNLAPGPNAQEIEAIIDATFWASLRREEGHSPKISLAFLPPEQAAKPILFAKRLMLNTNMLTKIAPGVERPGIHLGVWRENGELYVWGTTHNIPNFCFVLDVSEPGLLVIKHRRVGGFGKFANVAVLTGDQVKVIDESSVRQPDCPVILSSLLSFTSPSYWRDSVNVLVQLAVSMRAHKRGGALLIVPEESEEWRKSILHPIHYSVVPAFAGLADLIQMKHEEKESVLQAAIRQEVDNIAGLTAIDGATIIDTRNRLLAFGAKIGRADGKPLVDRIFFTEPIVGAEAVIGHPSQSGGTRHLSAAQFVHDQRDCYAFVASQDGRFTVFSWSHCEGIVQAHRIDALLL